jgi:formylglycine-generating enzyme required for sulfatase activity
LWSVDKWRQAGTARQDAIVRRVAAQVGDDFTYEMTRAYSADSGLRIASFQHRQTSIIVNLLPGGSYRMGLSDSELAAVQALDTHGDLERLGIEIETMRPAHKVTLSPFFCGRFPLLDAQAESLIELDDQPGRPDFTPLEEVRPPDEHSGNVLYAGWSPDEDVDDVEDAIARVIPIHLTEEEVDRLLSTSLFRLPSESEWEFAYRAGTDTAIPVDLSTLGPSFPRLLGLIDYRDENQNRLASNAFGLVGMAVGEFCADVWHANYLGAPSDGRPWDGIGPRVTRGGAASVWPWQDTGEWLLVLAAMRVPITHRYERMCGARLAFTLP